MDGHSLNVPLSNSLYEKLMFMFNDLESECRSIATDCLRQAEDQNKQIDEESFSGNEKVLQMQDILEFFASNHLLIDAAERLQRFNQFVKFTQ